MPGADGLTIAREIRAKSGVGIIMLTGRDIRGPGNPPPGATY
jgi:DNA-binding response OmpR family regulator